MHYYTFKSELRDLVIRVPGKAIVCTACEGTGTELYGSLKGMAFTQQDFDSDPDFAEDYFGGNYDVPCSHCQSRNIEIVPDVSACTYQQKRELAAHRAQLRYQREQKYRRDNWLESGCYGDY